MRIFLLILCLLSGLAGLLIFAAAKSAIHEIEAFVLFLIAAVFLVGAAIVDAIHSQRNSYAAPWRFSRRTFTKSDRAKIIAESI